MKLKTMRFPHDMRAISLTVIALLGGWIVSISSEGYMLYGLAKRIHANSHDLLTLSMIAQTIGFLLGGLLIRNMRASRILLIISFSICIFAGFILAFAPFWVCVISLMVSTALACGCFASCGYFVKEHVPTQQRFGTAVYLIISISVIKTLTNLSTLYISFYAGIALMLAVPLLGIITARNLPIKEGSELVISRTEKRELARAMLFLCLFILVVSLDFGIMMGVIGPKFYHIEWLKSWYCLVPYVCSAIIIKRLIRSEDRDNILYVAISMIGFAFVGYLLFQKTEGGFLFIFTLLMGGWAIYDVFWWGMLGEMLDTPKNAALIVGLGFGASVAGNLAGKAIAYYGAFITDMKVTIIILALISVTLVILPLLHRSLSSLLKQGADAAPTDISEQSEDGIAAGMDGLTDREKQIVSLMLKGKTCKLIADELYLSENTVKTHIKNVYSKLGVRRKSELFEKMML
jgi:DNA-binding CsgD family transcriptional regulator/MFS family permease